MLNQSQLETIINLQAILDRAIAQKRKIADDQNILIAKFLALIVEIAEFANEKRSFKYWSSKPASNKAILLEEYIDGLHFIISIANSLNLEIIDLVVEEKKYDNLNLAFLDLLAVTLNLLAQKNLAVISQWFNIYYSIARMCDFSATDIFEGYLNKNKINHLRQEQNY